MNVEYAMARRHSLQLVIKSYEDFLAQQIKRSPNRVRAIEALSSRDIVRTIAMSEVSKNRINRITAPGKPGQGNPALGTASQPLIEEASNIGAATQPVLKTPSDLDSDRLFKDLSECIPCNQNWSWGDFDWDRLKEILKMDLMARFRFLLDLEDMFNGNPILDRLCALLHCFKDLCPQDLLVLIGILTAYIGQVLDKIDFNLASALRDILGTLLRPYISGLEDFLNAYIQFLVDQVECILNSIQVSAESIRDLNIENTRGPKSLQFKKELTGGSVDKVSNDIAKGAKRANDFLNKDVAEAVHTVTDDIPVYLKSIIQETLDWVENSLIKAQDAIIDLLGGEWLVTQENIGWMDNIRSVATIINICEIIVKLGDIDELCSEDNVKKVIDQLNTRLPDPVVIIDDTEASPAQVASTVSPVSRMPNVGAVNNNPTTVKQFGFAIKDCLRKANADEQAMLRNWIQELS